MLLLTAADWSHYHRVHRCSITVEFIAEEDEEERCRWAVAVTA